MAWTVVVRNGAVIPGTLIGIAYEQRDRGTGCAALKGAGEDLDGVGLRTLGRIPVLSGLAQIQIRLYIILRQRNPGRAAVHDDSDALYVGFPPRGNSENSAKR